MIDGFRKSMNACDGKLLAGDKFVGTPTDQPPAAKKAMMQECNHLSVLVPYTRDFFVLFL